MRRIDRGAWPQENGRPRRFSPYRKAKLDLIERLGRYCNYCERTQCDLHVEHVVPKFHRSDLEEEWTNFLLSCVNCNSIKGDRNTSRDGYTWPDDDEPWNPFRYLPEGFVEIAGGLTDTDMLKAQNLNDLMGLDRRPGHGSFSPPDLRWLERRGAWRMAELASAKLAHGSTDVESVVMLAKATGFLSVWMTIFAGNTEVCGLLRQQFPGTR